MRVIVFGANGLLGQWTWKAAVSAGHEVVAFVRSPEKLDGDDERHAALEIVPGDVMDADKVREASDGCDIAVNCTSPAAGNGTLELARALVPNAAEAGVGTFYMVGGMGALWVPGSERSVLLQDWADGEAMTRYGLPADLPRERVRDMTKGHLASIDFMAETGLDHTFVCPGIMVDGPATPGRVVTLDDVGGHQVMRVNLGDVAQVIVDDFGRGALIGHRVCVAAR